MKNALLTFGESYERRFVLAYPSAPNLPILMSSPQVWINQGDIILLSLRDYQDEKGDVILKYTADEARSLKAYGELPENAKINETDTYGSLYPSPFVLPVLVYRLIFFFDRPRGCRRMQFRVRRRGRGD